MPKKTSWPKSCSSPRRIKNIVQLSPMTDLYPLEEKTQEKLAPIRQADGLYISPLVVKILPLKHKEIAVG